MSRHTALAGTLTIASGQQESNILVLPQGQLGMALTIVAPAALTGTVAIEGSMADSGTMMPLAVDGTPLVLTAGTIERFNISGVRRIQLDSGTNEGAERVATVYVEFDL